MSPHFGNFHGRKKAKDEKEKFPSGNNKRKQEKAGRGAFRIKKKDRCWQTNQSRMDRSWTAGTFLWKGIR